MFKRKTLRKIHIFSSLVSALSGTYLWMRSRRRTRGVRAGADRDDR